MSTCLIHVLGCLLFVTVIGILHKMTYEISSDVSYILAWVETHRQTREGTKAVDTRGGVS